MQNNTVTLSRQDLNKILESLNNIQAAIIALQISSNKEDQDIFKDIMCVCQLKDRRLVRLPKTPSCMELTQQYFGSDGELVCLLQNYGFTIANRVCPN